MGTTLTALNGQSGVTLATFVGVEGYAYMLTDADPTVGAVQIMASDAGFSGAFGGLSVTYGLNQSLSPWEPFNGSSSRVTLTLHNADSISGAETLSTAMFKREPSVSSILAEDLTPTETAITVKRSDAFAATGSMYIGCETVDRSANDTGTDTFTVTRGQYSPFKIEGGGGFGRTHYAVPVMPGIDLESTASTVAAQEPIDWKGRWVGVWLVRVVGGTYDSIAQAHCVFAGKIAEIEDAEDGKTRIHCIGVLDVLKETVILRRQWKARLREGVWVKAGTRFQASDARDGVPETADDLVCVAAGAAGAYQFNEGFYSGSDLASKINAWLAYARATDADLTFKYTFKYIDTNPDGAVRSSLSMSDPTAGTVVRTWKLSTQNFFVRSLLGWETDGGIGGSISGGPTLARSAVAISGREPLRLIPMANEAGDTPTFYIDDVTGSFVSQGDLLPAVAVGYVGVIRVGPIAVACAAPSVTNGTGTVVIGPQMSGYIGGNAVGNLQQTIDQMGIGVSQGGPVMVEQVLCMESSLGILVLSMLASTGGSNWPAYELLPEHCSAAIPYDLLTSGLETEIANAPWSGDVMRIVVDKPTKLSELWGVSFVLRHIQFVWRQGRIALKGWSTPTSAATLTIGTDDRAAAIGVVDSQRAVTRQSDEWMRNVIKIKSGASVDGEDFNETTTIEIPGSVSNHGARPVTLEARNAVRGAGGAAEDIRDLMPIFIAPLAFLSYPATLISIPVHFNLFEQATPGEVCLFTDGFARDPSTGTRGISAKPALVVGSRIHGWGGESGPPTGEIELMLFPRLSLAPYSPCAQVDDTAADAGYNAGTKVLTCYAHEHSEATAVAADASYFPATSKVRVIEIDPATAAAPLSWDDTVASQSGNTITLTVGLAGWDTTKKYRVYSDDYGDAVTAQKANSYQADDADALVANARAAYGLSFSATGQVTSFTSSAATELAERPPTAAYGDGVALDTGHARAISRSLNNLIGYGTAPQYPEVVTEMTFGGSGTWEEVYCAPVFLGVGQVANFKTRFLYVGPWLKSVTGASVSVRVTLSPTPPASSNPGSPSRVDVTRLLPYQTHTFTTSSATYAIATPVGLDISHCNLGEGVLGGWAWLYVEIGANAAFKGFGTLYLGPLETQ